ncbi:MAG: Rossmann-like and DUF2520 domain-containing protein [Gammaproteobacteria bacterium]
MQRLSIIGCGKVGRTLGKLWREAGVFRIGDILNRSERSAANAVRAIGAGHAVSAYRELQPADVWLVATSDDSIQRCCESLAASACLRKSDIVFHCSGALASAALEAASAKGAHTASVHPVKTFADPALAAQSFAGTWCGVEGDEPALDALTRAVGRIGGECFSIDPRYKTLYHAASVTVCNYLVALLDVGFEIYEKSGVERESIARIIEPSVRETVSNVFALGAQRALTGPVARGDTEVVAAHHSALGDWRPDIAALYAELGRHTLKLAHKQGDADRAGLAALESFFESLDQR